MMPRFLVALIALGGFSLGADPPINRFEVWGTIPTGTGKIAIYLGWSNGFFMGRPAAKPLAMCMNDLSYMQAVAMIDKYYDRHPEKWSHNLGGQILMALTVAGSPCENLDPYPPDSF